jgi:hypothetical protein
LNSPLPPFSSISPPPIPGIVSTNTIFRITHTCTQYLHHIHPPSQFSYIPLHSTGTNSSMQILFFSCSSILYKNKRRKEMIFLLILDSYTGSFLVHKNFIAQFCLSPLFFLFLP